MVEQFPRDVEVFMAWLSGYLQGLPPDERKAALHRLTDYLHDSMRRSIDELDETPDAR